MPPLGSERAVVESRPLHSLLLQLMGWRQLGPRLRYWHVQRSIPGARPTRIFEAGCGWGQNLFALQRRFAEADCLGADRDGAMIELARRIASHLPGRQPRFLVGDLQAVSLEGSFDLIVMSDVLES